MNSQRAVIWMAFLGTSAVLAWAPGHWFGQAPVETVEIRPAAARPAAAAQQATPAAARTSTGNLFPSQRWSTAP
ncbi:MAG TPA: hypothetical protein VJS90_19510, partial [Pseudomonas sp.]|nr:hypothetical protein [Pseudomonas sp.]